MTMKECKHVIFKHDRYVGCLNCGKHFMFPNANLKDSKPFKKFCKMVEKLGKSKDGNMIRLDYEIWYNLKKKFMGDEGK